MAQAVAHHGMVVGDHRGNRRLPPRSCASQSIYALCSGSFKTEVSHQNGCEQVSCFCLTGEVLGLDGICTQRHVCDAIALEYSAVCVIPFHLLEALRREMRSPQQRVHRMLSRPARGGIPAH